MTIRKANQQASQPAGAVRRPVLDGTLRDDQLGLAGQNALRQLDLALAADVQRRALMELRGLDVENAVRAIACRAAGLFDDERERIGLVQKTQLSLGRLAVGRVREDAAAEQIAVEIGDERTDVPCAERAPIA